MAQLSQRPVLITGCDSGFGYQLAVKCAKNGMPTFAGCLTSEGAEKLKLEALKDGLDSLHILSLDVTSQESINNAKAIIHEELRGISELILRSTVKLLFSLHLLPFDRSLGCSEQCRYCRTSGTG